MPRSTVSKLIADLEAHLGVQLMHRTTRRLSVTAEGQEYYQSAARLVVELDAADGAVRGRKLAAAMCASTRRPPSPIAC